MPDLSHRRAKPDDHQALLRRIAEYYAFDHIQFDAATAGPALAELLANDAHGRAYFVELEGQTAGYVLFTYGFDVEFGGRLATITDLYFEPQFRRRGLGERTLAFVAAECSALGLKAIELQVEENNLPAQALYRKMGFERLTRHAMSKALERSR